MSTITVPAPKAQTADRPRAAWFQSEALWAGLSIIAMWLAVLFVGVFGGDIVNGTPGGSSGSVPAVVAVAVCALIATVFVARWGFAPRTPSD